MFELNKEALRIVNHNDCHYAKIVPQAGIAGAEYPYKPENTYKGLNGEDIGIPDKPEVLKYC
jgi:hypothetical protein